MRRVVWIAAVPPLLVALGALTLGAGLPAAEEWFWPAPATNMAEAAATRDAARVRVLAGRAVDPNARFPVRPGLLDGDAPREMTPLEAAIRSRREELVAVVIQLGARPDTDEAQRLQCVATAVDAPRAAEILQRMLGAPPATCERPATR
jgi:hypothetical protein